MCSEFYLVYVFDLILMLCVSVKQIFIVYAVLSNLILMLCMSVKNN